jgi:hypothetical protein
VQQDILETFVTESSFANSPNPHSFPTADAEAGSSPAAGPHAFLVRFCYLAAEGTFTKLPYFLVWHSVKVRYKQTAIGVVWVLVQPLLIVLAFTLFFAKLAKLPLQGLPYPSFISLLLSLGCTSQLP